MESDRPDNLLNEHLQTGLLKRFALEHGFLFVNRQQWQRLPRYKQLLIMEEALRQCQKQNPDTEVSIRVIDDESGMRLSG